MLNFLFFETKTIGFPIVANTIDSDSLPRLLELCFLLKNEHGEVIKQDSFLIKPSGYKIPSSMLHMHSISNEEAIRRGVSIYQALGEFICAAIKADYLISYNAKFLLQILQTEARRVGVDFQLNDILKNRGFICLQDSTKYAEFSDLYMSVFKGLKPDDECNLRLYSECFFKLLEQNFYSLTSDVCC